VVWRLPKVVEGERSEGRVERWNEGAVGQRSPSIVYMFTTRNFIGVLSGSIVYKWFTL